MSLDIECRIDEWKKLLLDTSARNKLISTKFGARAALEILHPDAEVVWNSMAEGGDGLSFAWKRDLLAEESEQETAAELEAEEDVEEREYHTDSDETIQRCLTSSKLQSSEAVTGLTDKRLDIRLKRLQLNAKESLDERGVNTLYIAICFLKWYESPDSDISHESPLILVPVKLIRQNLHGKWSIVALDEEAERNECLAERFRNDFQIHLPELTEEDDATEAAKRFDDFLAAMKNLVLKGMQANPRWEIFENKIAIGHFDSRKLPMWKDLDKNKKRIASHRLCRAIAGDESSLVDDGSIRVLEPNELDDHVPVSEALHILRADSSQHAAIEAVKKGIDLVLDGPPGTGKSQTIANIIADRIGAGKTVLFVSEKAAALEVVLDRLRDCQLDDFCLALHDPTKTKRGSMCEEFKKALALKPTAYNDSSVRQQKQQERRAQLNKYVRALHQKREPLGLSFYDVFSRRARFSQLSSQSRLKIPDVSTWNQQRLEAVRDVLARLQDARSVFDDPEMHPWRGCLPERLTEVLRDDLMHHLGRLVHGLSEATQVARGLSAIGWMSKNPTWADFHDGVAEAGRVLDVPILRRVWLDVNPLVALQSIQKMPKTKAAHRAAEAMLPEFDIEAVCRTSEVPKLPESQIPLKNPRTDSVRSRLDETRHAREALASLRAQSQVLIEAMEYLAGRLPIDWNTLPVSELRKLLVRLRAIVEASPLPGAWAHPDTRLERKTLLDQAIDSLHRAESIRTRLATELSPVAFSVERSNLIEKAFPYRSRWRRLGFGWISVKREWRKFYSDAFPKHAVFRFHVEQLDDFHRLQGLVRNLALSCPEFASLGTYPRNWQAQHAILSAVLEYADSPTPMPLPPILFDSPVDKSVLFASLDRAERALVGFGNAWDALSKCIKTKPGIPTIPLKAVLKQVLPVDSHLGEHSDFLSNCVVLLRAESDLAFNALPDKLLTIERLRSLRAQIDELIRLIEPTLKTDEAIRRDWRADSEAAQKGEVYLNRNQSALSEEIRKALSDEKYRDNLRQLRERALQITKYGLIQAWDFVSESVFPVSEPVSTGIVLERASLDELVYWSEARREDAGRMIEWLTYKRARQETSKLGVEDIIGEIHRGEVKLEDAPQAFESRFLAQWIDAASESIEELADFRYEKHERTITEFIEADKGLTISATETIRSKLLCDGQRPTINKSMNPDAGLRTLNAEIQKKRSRKPLRKLFSEVPTTLLRLKPCWMMSPLAVSTFLDAPEYQFDLVIFDEASQVRPHDAICAIYRGKQLLVAGDPKQLPPTEVGSRTALAVNDDENESIIEYESILDKLLALSLPRKRLTWHYRSKREELIVFSNSQIYQGDLVTFPSPDDHGERPIRFIQTPDGRFIKNKNTAEASRVADLILEHIETRPSRSLGVIAFSIKQQEAIQDELENRLLQRPDLEQRLRTVGREPYFVKNLENVQGDQRDYIILSVAYAKNEHGKLLHNFGPLNKKGGERRLNVAITRAQYGMTVVTSIHPSEMDVEKLSHDGPKLLKAFLQFAEQGPEVLPRLTTHLGDEHESPFELAVAEELSQKGVRTRPQVGCAGYRIDLGVYDPMEPGRYLLGIECDGAMYHSAATARDRDRLRQEVLEDLGWTIIRIWSSDWFRNRNSQVDRVITKIEEMKQRRTESRQREQSDVVQPKAILESPKEGNTQLSLPFQESQASNVDSNEKKDNANGNLAPDGKPWQYVEGGYWWQWFPANNRRTRGRKA